MELNLTKITRHDYDTDLKQLDSQFYIVLGDLEKSYVDYKNNPENPIYEKRYNEKKDMLTKVIADTFLLGSSLETQKENINKDTDKINDVLSDMTDENEKLKEQLNGLESSKNTASGNISYKQNLYNTKIFDIGLLMFLTVGLTALIYKKAI